MSYDWRKTNAASTDAARRVGTITASVAAASRIATAPANATGSCGETPKSIDATTTRLIVSAAAAPMPRPMTTGR